MIRYCTNCRKDFDFTIKSMKDLDSLVCPECGSKIDKDSRSPAYEEVSRGSEKTEDTIGHVFGCLMTLNYIFYIAISVAAIVAYNFHWDKLLYILTGISLGLFVIQLFFRAVAFRTGLIFLPLGAAIGYFVLKSVRGACLGIAIVFIIRHLIRELFWRLFSKLF
ncbi:MAG: zinc ribbon domain-containing protein [Treponema sp.]|nr:zinc ribbon domain-containing protein [Treponema sp.]MBP5752101.1 zinc ribbon domain-containing protein [Treponema sp.]